MQWRAGRRKATDLIWRIVIAGILFYLIIQVFGMIAASIILAIKPAIAAVGPALREPLVFLVIGLICVGIPTLFVRAIAWLLHRERDTAHGDRPSETSSGAP
jgi:hypothetical protein